MLLIKFYEASKGANSGEAFQDFARKRLAQVTFDNDKSINIDDLSRLFNSHEKELLKGPGEIIAQASHMINAEDAE